VRIYNHIVIVNQNGFHLLCRQVNPTKHPQKTLPISRIVMKICELCNDRRACIKRPKTLQLVCQDCFFLVFETEVHRTIVDNQLFTRGETVAIAASGGKGNRTRSRIFTDYLDSTVLAHVMKLLNARYDYGLQLHLLSIDEGIKGYRDDSLETVHQNSRDYQLPLLVLSYEDIYGWSMDRIVDTIGRKNNCTFCGVFRRQALERGAKVLNVDSIVTGHNADDIAETVLMNVLRGDMGRLGRCTAISTSGDEEDLTINSAIRRVKPFKYTYEKEIVMYAHYKRLVYFSTECTYSPNAYRGYARHYLKDLERIRASAILDIIRSGEQIKVGDVHKAKMPDQVECSQCGFLASQPVCKACLLLEGLNQSKPKVTIGQ
jgi:cytoplasmic tRNA 2-thiolation protein 1